jgi:hypothetical protein
MSYNNSTYKGIRKQVTQHLYIFSRSSLLKKNIIASGLCTCGKIETTAHCLLHWPNYIFIRNETIQTLGTIDVQSLIFELYFPNQSCAKASTASEPGFQKRELNLSVLSRMIMIKKKAQRRIEYIQREVIQSVYLVQKISVLLF